VEKKKILDQLIAKAKEDLRLAKEAADSAASYRESGDMKAEGKYDTRSIEAGYLAGAQKKRVDEMQLELQLLEEIPRHDYGDDDDIAIGALVHIEHKGKTRPYLLSPTAGGTLVDVDGVAVMVLSVFSPIGQELIGLKVGDEFEVRAPSELRQYLVTMVK
jgi:transcription elongation GreA/GreB family factor